MIIVLPPSFDIFNLIGSAIKSLVQVEMTSKFNSGPVIDFKTDIIYRELFSRLYVIADEVGIIKDTEKAINIMRYYFKGLHCDVDNVLFTTLQDYTNSINIKSNE